MSVGWEMHGADGAATIERSALAENGAIESESPPRRETPRMGEIASDGAALRGAGRRRGGL